MDVKFGPVATNDEAETVANLEREIAEAEAQVADLQKRIRVAEVEATAARRPNQFDAMGVAPVLTSLAKRPEPDFELTMTTGILVGLLGGGFVWLVISALLKR